MWNLLLAYLEVLVVRPVKMSNQRRSSCSELPFTEFEDRRRGCFWGLLGARRAASTDLELRDINTVSGHGGRYQYTALEADSTAHERLELERKAREQAQSACLHYLRCCPRYSLLQHLNDIGSRVDKHWFIVRDGSVKTERLLTLVPKSPNCPILTDSDTRQVILDLFLALQHPYIYPVLDLEFREGVQANQTFIVLVLPFNTKGSLKDLIYKHTCLHDFCFLKKRQRTASSYAIIRQRMSGACSRRENKRACLHSSWQDDWCDKYGQRSEGLPISQVQRLGRQILEALLFLKERGFPCCSHLHSGNVILQNGVARLSGLENTLFGFTSRIHPVIWSLARQEPSAVDVICFGHVLFEMCAGYELTTPKPSASNLADIENYPQVVEVLDFIFQNPKCRYPSIEELLVCDFFRNIDLREMRATSLPQVYHARLTASTLALLNDVKKQQKTKRGRRSHSASVSDPPSPSPRRDREQRSNEAERLDDSKAEAAIYKCPILPSNDYSLACDEATKLDLETRVTTSDGESADDESSNPETPHDSDEDTTGDSAQEHRNLSLHMQSTSAPDSPDSQRALR